LHDRVLVTGADGFIGSHLVEALVREGSAVRAMSLYNSFDTRGWLDALPQVVLDAVEVVPSDIRDPYGVRQAVKGCDLVMHLAALIAIPYSYVAPDAYVETNIRGTVNVLQAVRDLEVPRMVHTSTSEVYGTAQYVPIDEKHPVVGQSPYSASKIAADQLAVSFHRSFGTPLTICRPFNTYGPRQSTRAVIPTVITQLASGTRTLRLGALEPTRDFSHVSDTAAGFIALAQSDAAIGRTVNLGSGFEITIGDTVRLVAEVMGVDATIEQEDERIRPAGSEVERLFADNTQARELTTWRPAYAGLEGFRRGLEETAKWFSEPINLARYRPGTYTL
jgi:NAD dependent epimerase/dehydratase